MSEPLAPAARHLGWLRLLSVCALVTLALLGCSSGSESTTVELSPLATQGLRVVETEGCASCHGADGAGVVGPAWTGLIDSEVELEDGTTTVADEAYLRRAILEPAVDIRAGFSLAMPENALTEEDADAVLAYLKELP